MTRSYTNNNKPDGFASKVFMRKHIEKPPKGKKKKRNKGKKGNKPYAIGDTVNPKDLLFTEDRDFLIKYKDTNQYVQTIKDRRCHIYTSGLRHTLGMETGAIHDSGLIREQDDEYELQLAAMERVPAYNQTTTSPFDPGNYVNTTTEDQENGNMMKVDIPKLGVLERRALIDRLLNKIEEDHHKLLLKQKRRLERVGLEYPTVEVRYQNLCVEAECEVVHGKPLPTLWNSLKRVLSAFTNIIWRNSRAYKIKILKDIHGIIRPSRMTLLLGHPGCGKSTLLLALAGKLDPSLKVTGTITYNGYNFNEFVPQKTSSYISQHDRHTSEMTVRETLNFAARCQGIGSRADIKEEVCRREKQAGIIPEPDIDIYMREVATEGLKETLQTDYILKILGLDTCADTVVGDAMRRGISGGQKKRLTTGEMLIGPAKVLLMDEISNGLDSSTTFQIVTCLQQLTHITGYTTLVSLLQPAPETFSLFDDIILMAEGMTIYHGPKENVLEFFKSCGFRCPPRKGIADFLQEVVSVKDQGQYWENIEEPYIYISAQDFERKFRDFYVGKDLDYEISHPLNKTEIQKNPLSPKTRSVKNWELFRACMAREWLLMKRNSFVHVFKSVQLVITAIITMTVFIRTRTNLDDTHANFYMSSLFYALVRIVTNGVSEVSMTYSRLPVFYKQRDFYFYPAWTYAIPAFILKIPFSFLDAFLWTVLTYYVIGYTPEPERFVCQLLLLFVLHQVSISSFRLLATMLRNPSFAVSCSLFSMLVMFLLCGFIIPQSSLPAWLQWGFWISPITYAEISISTNEFLAPRWKKVSSTNFTIGQAVLTQHGLNYSANFYWISIGALVGFWMVLNVGFTLALSWLKSPGRSRTIISRESISKPKAGCNLSFPQAPAKVKQLGMVLPFEPVTLTFQNVQYYVNTPMKMKENGFEEKRLQLLQDITGSFRPGILTALMGVTGAGKTTLLDVLSGRKTSGNFEGEIKIGGYPKVQAIYSRLSAYCEQTDMHSPMVTIKESLAFSARLRLSSQLTESNKNEFVEEVLSMIELDDIKDALVGFPGVNGISYEQRKRLTIAVELVSNPSIIFMDEPTSGLDARAAAIVMRVVKNIADTGRTIVCTIHQPSINIFEAFDELLLMNRGGHIIFAGPLGPQSSKLIEYFEGIPGVPKLQENSNPATWMLEITSASTEVQLGLDFGQIYKRSHLYGKMVELVKDLSFPVEGLGQLKISTCLPRNGWEQFKACLWKQNLSYWRSPNYNLVRLTFITMVSLLLGGLLWQKGNEINDEQDLLNILGTIYIFVLFLGIANCSSVQSYIATERAVVWRERFAGMYSSLAHSLAQVVIEIPYLFLQAFIFVIITYPAIGFYWSVNKVFWYFYTTFCTVLYFTYLGMLLFAITPSLQVASIMATFSYTILSLFSGFLIPGPVSQLILSSPWKQSLRNYPHTHYA
ncbi:pleiotropic drug resistance protein 3-like [Apium graveolens]|uniref:pleiotropic drug resistance protein 3-like n=1 Tax=Apium graveolens TaxID=4045 RepID=UPI003D794A94